MVITLLTCTCALPGISLKTQELYTLVFVCRYLDLFTNFISMCAATPAMHVTPMLCTNQIDEFLAMLPDACA